MRSQPLKPPFKFDLTAIAERMQKLPVKVDGITLKFPGVNVSVKVKRAERKVAKEVVIRLSDRRVLNSFECCDDCIKRALASLQDIRRIILDKQVELADAGEADGALYASLDSIREAIRQFQTFTERIQSKPQYEARQLYFDALEMLRAHTHRTLLQVAKVAGMEIPNMSDIMRYDENWQPDAYKIPKVLQNRKAERG